MRLSPLLFAVSAAVPCSAEIDLTGDIWDVGGVDDAGTSWDQTTLLFTVQIANGPDYDLAGYFDWIGSSGSFGRENFTGTLFANNTLNLTGRSLEAIPGMGGPTPTIINGEYFAILEANGNQMSGDWGGNNGGIPGDFIAKRIPEPSASLITVVALSLTRVCPFRSSRHF